MKVFRRIRKKLLADKKFRNYIPYAIGEIILVVIGILIALAINNANLRNIKAQKEKVYLEGLYQEFTTSKTKLSKLIEVNKNNYEGAKHIIKLMDTNPSNVSEVEFSELLFRSFAFDIAFNPNNSLLLEMISSGSLRDISNDDLRVRLTTWLATLEDIAKQEADLALQRNQVLDLFGDQNSIRTILDLTEVTEETLRLTKKESIHSNMDMLNSIAFENKLLFFILTSIATEETHYSPLMDEIDVILALLDEEMR